MLNKIYVIYVAYVIYVKKNQARLKFSTGPNQSILITFT